jgi:dCTP deaminase
MTILSDRAISSLADSYGMITPFVDHSVCKDKNGAGLISYGLSSFGYDARLANEFKIFTNINSTVVDPKSFDYNGLVDRKTDVCIIPPNSFILGRTVERFKIPRNIWGVCIGKSTYTRSGIIINVTPLEPGSDGHVVLEFSNTTQLPAKIYAGEGVCQFVFFKAKQECQVSYADRDGKYMKQTGVVLPTL